jgi:hypothetical protein
MFDSKVLAAYMFSMTFDDFIHSSLFLVELFHNRAQGVVHGVELLELLI